MERLHYLHSEFHTTALTTDKPDNCEYKAFYIVSPLQTSCRWPARRFSGTTGTTRVSWSIIIRSRLPDANRSAFHANAPTIIDCQLLLLPPLLLQLLLVIWAFVKPDILCGVIALGPSKVDLWRYTAVLFFTDSMSLMSPKKHCQALAEYNTRQRYIHTVSYTHLTLPTNREV